MPVKLIYHECGINLDSLSKGQQVNCTKVRVIEKKNQEIIEALKKEYPDLKEESILLILLNWGPSVDCNQKIPVILDDGCILNLPQEVICHD